MAKSFTAKMLTYDKAMTLLSQGAVMMRMHDNTANGGMAYYIIPQGRQRGLGGRVYDDGAEKLLGLPRMQPSEDGLFPGVSQTFKLRSQP
jgi:hypothetical protein